MQGGILGGPFVGRCLGTLVDPALDQVDLANVERLTFSLGWHAKTGAACDRRDDQALAAVSGCDRRAASAAGQQACGGIEPQATLLPQWTVTGGAALGEDWF